MKNIRCINCKSTLENKAQVCPKCGRSIVPVKPWVAITFALLAGIAVFLMIFFGGARLLGGPG